MFLRMSNVGAPGSYRRYSTMRNGAMVGLGSGSTRELEGVALTRYACYLIAQNGDAAKPEIANFEGTCG